jgi:peptidyl-prolyl cis-trans isomerase B (cyclophilin B)
MTKKSRERQLAKLQARRAAERRKKHRQRILAGTVAGIVAVSGLGFLGFSLLTGNGEPSAAGTPTPTPTASASSTPTPGSGGVACGGKVPKAASDKKKTYKKPPPMTVDTKKTYVMTMRTSCGTIEIELDPKLAPKTVNSLVFLAGEHFFDGTIFHRVVKDFVIQGGDPTGSGTGGPGYKTVDAPPKGTTYKAGDLAMAKAGNEAPGTSGSQFFIVTGDPAALNATPVYALVGKVLSGLDVAKRIEQLPAEPAQDGKPVQTVYIVKVTVKAA